MKYKSIITCALFVLILGIGSSLCLFLPKSSFSESERRPLKEKPEFNTENVINGKFMDNFEEYTTDNFPFREAFRGIKAAFQLFVLGRSDNNGIYLSNGHISDADYPMNGDKLNYAAGRLNYIYEKLLRGKTDNIYLSIIPDKNYYIAENADQLHIDYEKLYREFPEMLHFAEFIDIRNELDADSYYKTDTHWRQEKIIGVAKLISEAMGKKYSGEFEKIKLDVPFKGVYHGQAALPISADEIYYLTNDTIESAKVYDMENSRETDVYDMTKKDTYDPYEIFLSGPLSLVTVENPSAAGGHLVIFRDSFGSSIAPLLLENYSKITLIDTRYIMPDILSMLVDFEDADVLFLYSSMILNNGDTLK